MKKLYILLSIIIYLFLVNIVKAQVSNNQVNYQLKAQSYWSNMNNDIWPNADDNEIALWIGTDGNSGGTKILNNAGSLTCTGKHVFYWNCDAACTNADVDRNIYTATGVTALTSMSFTLNHQAWESDYSTWTCTPQSGDDYVHAMNYSVNFKNGEANNANLPANSFSYYHGGNPTKDGWINGAWSVTSGTRASDVRIKTIWRYTNGYDCGHPLDFGTLTVGAAALTHINTNRGVPAGADANMGYANVLGNAAPDVFYSFTLTSAATVVISTVDASTNYNTFLRLYNSDCSVQIASNDDYSGTQSQITQYLCAGTYKIVVEGNGSSVGNFKLSVSANNTTPPVPTTPVAGTFGTNEWYVYGYDGGNLDLTGSTYRGYYVETGLSYNTTSKWGAAFSPSYAPGWNGNCVNVDNHVVVSKRQGFTCGVYQLNVPSHDDDIRVYINGAASPDFSHTGCCDAHTNIWTGYLNSSSIVEVRHIDGTGNSNQELTFANVTTALNGGTIAGITNGANVCQGTDPGAFTSSANASGGTIGVVNGSPAAPTYQWQRATDAAFTAGLTNVGTNSPIYDPDNSLPSGTYYFRRKVTDACATIAYSNTIQINIIQDISATTPTATAATSGACTRLKANWNAVAGATSYRLDVATDASFSSIVSGFNDLNVGNVTSYDLNLPLGTYYYRVRAVNACFTSLNSNVITATIANPGVNGNDYFRDAIDISATLNAGSVYNGSFNNSSFTTETGEPTPQTDYGTAWYKFTTNSSGLSFVTAKNAEGSGSDNTTVTIYKRTGDCFSLSNLASDYACVANNISVTKNCLDPNTTYYVQFGTTDCALDGGARGNYNVTITPGPTAGPDNICNAARIGAGDIGVNQTVTTGTYTNVCSTVNTGGYTDPINADGNDATDWFYFTTPSVVPAYYTFQFNNIADFGTWGGLEGEVYKKTGGTCPPTLSYVGSWDPAACGVVEESGIFCLDPNSTYYIMVDAEQDGVCGGRGQYQVVVKGANAPKAADICTNAVDLGTLNAGALIGNASGSNRWNNFCATAIGDPNPGWGTGDPYQPVWFKFTTAANAGRDVDFEAYNDPASLGDQINLRLALYEGCGGTKIFAEGTQPLFSESVNTKCLKPSTTYYLMVDGVNALGGGEGYFGLTVKDNGPYPANDLVCGATGVTVQSPYTYNSTFFASETNVNGTYCFEPEPDWTAELGKDNDHGVWYYFGKVPGRTIVADANSLSGDNIDLQMALYSSTTPKGSCVTPASTPALTLVQKEYSIPLWDEDAYFNCLDPNLYYWLMVDGADATGTGVASALEQGNFSLKFWFPEEGETTFCTAEDLGSVPDGGNIYIRNLSNICGVTSFSNAPAPSAFGFDKAVVYKFTTPPAVGFSDASVKIEAFSNPYYDKATHSILGGPGGNMGIGAGDAIDLQLALYSDGPCGSSHYVKGSFYDPTTGSADPTGLTGSNEELIVSCLSPSTVYYLVVDGGTNTNGYYDLKISDYARHTTNDFLCQAIDITGTYNAPWTNCNSSTVVQLNNQNNYCATTNNDIPSSLGIRPPAWVDFNSPVWYKFKAPKSGKLKIEAINSLPDLIPPYDEPEMSIQLAVFFLPGGYKGTCANLATEKERLVYIASGYDGLLHDEEMTVDCLMPDSIYYLLVDGTKLATLCPTCDRGEFYLKLTADPRDRPSTNDLPCDAIDLGTPAVWTTPTIYDTKVSPASGAGTYASPTSGYPSATGLHNGARNNSGSCMRAENNFCAGIDNEPAVSGGTFFTDFSPDATVWYKFTAPSTGEVKINTFSDPDSRGDLLYTQIAVFETSDNTCTGTMVGIAADGIPDNLNGDNELTVKCLDPGKTYFIMVDGSGVNKRGYFELQIQAVPATLSGPPNDDICNATSVTYPASIGATTTVNNQTNRCATIQAGVYPSPTTFTTDADVWYKFTTPNTAGPHAVEVTVTSGLPWPFGDAMDPQIALYKQVGTCPSATFELVDDEYSALGAPFYEKMEFHCLEQNTTYYLMVDGSGLNEQGNFKLDVKRITPHPLAANDDICAVGVTFASGNLGTLGSGVGNKVGNTTTNWHNFCSNVEPGENALMTDGAYSLDQTVWFHFKTPAVANNIDVEIRALNDPNNVGDQIDLQMLLAQGTPTCSGGVANFSSLTTIDADDPALTFNSTIRTCLPPNTDFYIQVDGSGLNTQGYFTLEVENKGNASAPSNDNICNAKILPSGGAITNAYTGYTNDDNNCATLESFEKQQVAGSIQRSVWYKFTAPASADVSIEVKGNSWVPFSQNYFLPDITIWELSDNTYASIDNTIAGCNTPTASNWNQLEFNDYKGIPNSLANGVYPTVVLTPQCLKPGYTYYVQVDGTAGIGIDGYFSIQIKDNQLPYSAPGNNEATGAITVPISSTSCQYSNGTWQGGASGYSFGNNPTWSNPNLIGIANSSGTPSCNQNCGDVWFKFQMPAVCGNNTKSFVKIEGDDEFDLDLNGYPELAIAAYNGGNTGSTANLTYLKCSVGGSGVDPDFSIAANPGDWIYLQIWDLEGNEQGKHFKLCISEQKSADDCVDATNMTLDIPYCWSIESNTGETPNSAVPGSGLATCFDDGIPKHSTYFKFTTDATGNFCDDYYVYINTPALAKLLPSGANHACISGTSSSVSVNYALWKLKPGGTLCTPGAGNVTQTDCITWNDCGGGSFGANVVGPHGNGGIVDDTIWYNMGSGQQLEPNTTYYIILDYKLNNVFVTDRVILDGIIQVGRRCKGRVWEYTTAPVVTSNKYCTTRDGWRHYYDDKGTLQTSDDKYIFSLYPNGNDIEGTVTVNLQPTRYSYEDIPRDYAEYVMKRRWDFTINSGTINPSKPVKIRFYYQTLEKQDIIDAAITFRNTYGGFYEDFEWFKSENGHVFDPLTDVNPKVISVGANGYSETGCLSYWNASGVYVGAPGVQRCNSLIAEDWEDNNTNQSCNGIHYVEYRGLTGFSGGTGGTGVSPWDISPLPVELTTFTGYNDGSKNVLNWTTASEMNTLKFEVERANNISSPFVYIGEKPAAGQSNQLLHYTLDDLNPMQGDNYYRLKMIDKDGTFKYSHVILININQPIKYEDAINSVYPNPTSNSINVNYQSFAKSDIDLKIFDALGQEMFNSKFEVQRGNQIIKLDVANYANGVYIIHIQDLTSGKIMQAKFRKD
ncbi:MAG: T9SS type A sorting domain-containing protein [Chitinophagales bacterium]